MSAHHQIGAPPGRVIPWLIAAILCIGVLPSGPGYGATSNSFPELAQDFANACNTAFSRSRVKGYVEVKPVDLLDFDPPPSGRKDDIGLVFEEYQQIRTKAFYDDGAMWASARPRGNVEKLPLTLSYARTPAGSYLLKSYLVSDFDYGSPAIQPALPTSIPTAARVISAVDLGARLGQSSSWPQFLHSGTNAFNRMTGLGLPFGTSFRWGAYDVDVTDQKPQLTRLNLRPLAGRRFALIGVIESKPYTACIQAVIMPDLSTDMQTTMRIYPRTGYVGPPGAKVSPLALSSMLWKGQVHTPTNPADEAHDADTLAICGQDATDLQGFVPAFGSPPTTQGFGQAVCFGLLQLDRDATHYGAYAAADYARRPNLVISNIQSDLPYSIKLMGYGTPYERENNIVAYAEFNSDLPVPLAAANGTSFSYTLTATTQLPITEPRITVGAAIAGDAVGSSVAKSGDLMAVGAPGGSGRPGALYLFKSTPFGQVAGPRIIPNDSVAGDRFGATAALSADTLVVGAPGRMAAYVFVRSGETWVQQARLSVTASGWGDAFGSRVSLSGDTLAVSAPFDNQGSLGSRQGAVYVYRRQGQVWALEATLIANDHAPWDYFGSDLSLDGQTLAVGAPGDDYPGLWEQGSAYVFERTGTTWTQTAKLTADGGWKNFGQSVALSAGQLLVGVPLAHGSGWRTSAGDAYAYKKVGNGWTLTQWIRPNDWQNGDEFGTAVSFQGSLAVIGAGKANGGAGAAYLYTLNAGTWIQGTRLNGATGAELGTAVTTDGVSQLIGAPREELNRGTAYWYPVPTVRVVNLALNPSCSGYPSVAESSPGWGGGTSKCSIIDGKREYTSWANGLAFTGGHQDANGGPPYVEPAGPRNVVVDFGQPRTVTSLVVWQHGENYTPQTAWIRSWNGQKWVDVPFVRMYRGDVCENGTNSGYACKDIYTLRTPIKSVKVQYGFDNSGFNILGSLNIHGWIYEVEVNGPGN